MTMDPERALQLEMGEADLTGPVVHQLGKRK